MPIPNEVREALNVHVKHCRCEYAPKMDGSGMDPACVGQATDLERAIERAILMARANGIEAAALVAIEDPDHLAPWSVNVVKHLHNQAAALSGEKS